MTEKNGHDWLPWLGLALTILLQTTANGLSKQAGLASLDPRFRTPVENPWYIAMMVALVAQAFVWMLVLRRLPLSLAYSVTSLVFPATLVVAWLFFSEQVQVPQILGTAAILVGIMLMNQPGKSTT